MKVTISRLSSKEIRTARGPAEVWHFYSAAQNLWYDSFVNSWNSDWQEGTEIEVGRTQLKERRKGDRTYLTIGAPPRGAHNGEAHLPPPPAAPPRDDRRAIELLEIILGEIRLLKVSLARLAPEKARSR